MAVFDLHCHLLPGIDDGPDTLAGSLAMARAAVGDGITTVTCTPHMIRQYPTAPEDVHRAVDEFRDALREEDIPLRVLPGGEISLEWLPRMSDDDLRAASLGGTGRWLLLEVPFQGWPIQLPRVLDGLELRGFGVVLAHPERNASVQTAPDRMRDIVGRGALVQLTASSLTGDHGARAKAAGEALLRNGMVHVLATDAHSADWRPPVLSAGLEAAAKVLRTRPEAIEWMVDEGPRTIAAGETVRPPRLVPGAAGRRHASGDRV